MLETILATIRDEARQADLRAAEARAEYARRIHAAQVRLRGLARSRGHANEASTACRIITYALCFI